MIDNNVFESLTGAVLIRDTNNVIVGERYKEVTDQIIQYALGYWGKEGAELMAPGYWSIASEGVAGDGASLGYFGYAYYEENQTQLRAVAVDNGSGCVAPNRETIASGEYAPLARPMFIYVSRQALSRPEVRSFLRFYMENAEELVPQVGYVPVDASVYQGNLTQLQETDGAG